MTGRGTIILERLRGQTDSTERLGGAVGMIISDHQWRPYITCSDIIHIVLSRKGKPIAPRTIPSKALPPRRRIRKKLINSQKNQKFY